MTKKTTKNPDATAALTTTAQRRDLAGNAAGTTRNEVTRAVGADDPQRQAVELVRARLYVPKVEPLDDDSAAAEQIAMGGSPWLTKFFNRQVVDADHLDAVLGQVVRPFGGESDVILVKFG